jgi:DNA-binding IclR family transcriptional regulator
VEQVGKPRDAPRKSAPPPRRSRTEDGVSSTGWRLRFGGWRGEMERKIGYSAPALEKGLDILELFARHTEPLTLTRIAEELHRSKSEIFRMVMVLLERGYLQRDGDSDRLMLSNRLFSLGLATPRARDLMSAAIPVLNRLAATTGHFLHLVVLHRGETVVIASASGAADVSFSLNLGYHRPALDATSGQVIVAFQPAETQEALIREGLPLLPPGLGETEIRATLARIRAQGYEYHESRDFEGLVDVCCPVLDGGQRALASVLMTRLRRHGQRDRLLDGLATLQEGCSRIAAEMGLLSADGH